MVWQGLGDEKERKFVRNVVITVIACWFVVAVLPLIALNWSAFRLNTSADVERVKSVLGQLGTYGDMFGLLNCLFSGLALIGVAYAVVLQRQDSKRQAMEAKKAARSADLQNRLAAYQSMADHHRYQRDNAIRRLNKDKLLEARSRGREIAYAELMKTVLVEIEAHAEGREAPKPEQPFDDHPARVRNLRNFYENDCGLVADSKDSFGPVEEHPLDLVEEIAALTELVRDNDDVQKLLLKAGHAVNAAVDPEPAMDRPEATEEEIRAYQRSEADAAFRTAIKAVRALGFNIPE